MSTPKSNNLRTPANKGKAATPRLVAPSAEVTLILIRSTLLSLDQAMETGNYTVLRDLASPSFRAANSAGKLYQVFANLSAQRISLAAVAIMAPKLAEPPTIDANAHLHIRGYFPGEPIQIDFDLVFEAVAAKWRVLGITVNPVKSAAIKPLVEADGKGQKPPGKGK